LCDDKERSAQQLSADSMCLTDAVSQNGPQSTIVSFSILVSPLRQRHVEPADERLGHERKLGRDVQSDRQECYSGVGAAAEHIDGYHGSYDEPYIVRKLRRQRQHAIFGVHLGRGEPAGGSTIGTIVDRMHLLKPQSQGYTLTGVQNGVFQLMTGSH
jgi:hypothetical protein